MTQVGKQAREKGLNFERYICKRFRLAGWAKVKRHLEAQVQEAKGFDLDHTEPFLVQVKRHKDYAPISTLFDIETEPGTVPVLVSKPDGSGPTVAVLLFEDFLRLAATSTCQTPPTKEDF